MMYLLSTIDSVNDLAILNVLNVMLENVRLYKSGLDLSYNINLYHLVPYHDSEVLV